MDVMLQRHNGKPVCDIPDGLRELCADISREVIRCQPDGIYCFVAEYLAALLITRENAKVAIKVVQNVMLKSEQIVEILSGSGIRLEKIAAAAPRLQKAFRAYLEAVDRQQRKECGCDADSDEVDSETELSVCKILEETGATYKQAYCAAVKIQAMFRGHYERMRLAESRGEVQWQRAAVNTMEILRKSGVSRNEAQRAAVVIQSVYRGYYTRKNLSRQRDSAKRGSFDKKAWLDRMYEDSGVTPERANEAAILIQNAFREHLERRSPGVAGSSSTTNVPAEKSAEPISVAKVSTMSQDNVTSQLKPAFDGEKSESEADYLSVKLKSNVAISVGTGTTVSDDDDAGRESVKATAAAGDVKSEKREDDDAAGSLHVDDEKSTLDAQLNGDEGENDDDEGEI